MLSPGMLIALDVMILYLVMSPLVLFALYVLFDALGHHKKEDTLPLPAGTRKNSVLWSDEDCAL